MARNMPLSSGARFGPYEILAPLGAGGMGQVYRARDTRLGRDVAIKVLPGTFSRDQERLIRFEQEARAASLLNHPNILTIYDIGVAEETPFVVSEFLEGETLRERLREGGLPPRKAIEYGLQICHGLAAVHGKGIIHRDLKPENLFLTKDGRVKILDFGLAKLTAPAEIEVGETSAPTVSLKTVSGVVMGTVGYMSPEQVRGQAADPRSDLFAFGCVFYEMLSGHRAFGGDTAADAMTAILKEDPPDLCQLNHLVSPALGRVVGRSLEKDPEERFQSARDLGFALDALSDTSRAEKTAEPPKRKLGGKIALALAAALLTIAAYLIGERMGSVRAVGQAAYHPLTFSLGTLFAARFAPDGKTVVYAAAWGGNPVRLFMTRPDGPESRPLELTGGNLFAISSSGEMAVSTECVVFYLLHCGGTLARMPLSGGGPRAVLGQVSSADWSPDGKDLAVVHEVEGHRRVEFPLGNVVYDTTEGVSSVRVSPDGEMLALAVHPAYLNDQGDVVIVDRLGKTKTTAGPWNSLEGIAWSPSGTEVWFAASVPTGAWADEIRALSPSGKQRFLLRLPGITRLHDVSRDGRILISKESWRSSLFFRGPRDSAERDLSWLDASTISDISADGSAVVFSETGEGPGAGIDTYLRNTNGSPAVLLGPGNGSALSPDQKWVLAITNAPNQLALLPTGIGETKTLATAALTDFADPGWFPDSKRVVFAGRETGKGWRMYAQDLAGGEPLPISPEINLPGPYDNNPLSPDGKFVWARDLEKKAWLYPLDGSTPRQIPITPADFWLNWGTDVRSAYVLQIEGDVLRCYAVDLSSGDRQLVKQVAAADRVGITGILGMKMTPKGDAYAYSPQTALSQLYLVTGLK
ncbi:MAG TPA: protein kinase [Terriglobales bacterium]|nr:protein kinase [Terriglobales bacterium]